jgi:uncharacterized lipoprotein YmbA
MALKHWATMAMVVLATIGVCSGCRSASPASSFYTLSAVVPSPAAAAAHETAATPAVIGVGPVSLPKMLNRAQIVTRTAPNRVVMDDFHRWAGDLEENFLLVLTENLSGLMAPQPVRAYPWEGVDAPRYRVAVTIQRLDGSLERNAVIDVIWTIADGDMEQSLLSKRSVITEPVEKPDYDSFVAAQSRAIGILSEEMADALKSVVK